MSHNNDEIYQSFDALGHIAWLWASSPLHRDWPLSVFAINVLPAIRHNQYILLMRNGFPIAYCSWANLSLDKEVEYIEDVVSLVADDWISGDRRWLIDWIAPFGDSDALYKQIRKLFPDGLFRAIRIDPETRKGRIAEFHGGKIDKKLANKIFAQYHYELISKLKIESKIKLMEKSE